MTITNYIGRAYDITPETGTPGNRTNLTPKTGTPGSQNNSGGPASVKLNPNYIGRAYVKLILNKTSLTQGGFLVYADAIVKICPLEIHH